ncbi:MAG: DUF4914 family protein [Clostridiales bacterium]|jgi:hypothetical protein|nr:DUF4914 family protein [Clostridiales bacterium]
MNQIVKKMVLPGELRTILTECKGEIILPKSREHLIELALGGTGSSDSSGNMTCDVSYEVPGKGLVREAYVAMCKNGVVANFDDITMRRRDPNSMVIADDLPTDKPTHEERFGTKFDSIRTETFEWLKDFGDLILMPFVAGSYSAGAGYPSLLLAPANAGFFALALADLQGFIPLEKVPNYFKPRAVVYVAPPFRHIHYEGQQVVVHNRLFDMHEVFSFNLYPGPSAKKGIYGVLLDIGEQEKWVTLHASTVTIVTPYELTVTIMHEGASGGGKSEMLEAFHRQSDGRMLLGENIVSDEKYIITMADTSTLHPVTDDMAVAHPSIQNDSRKLVVADAEDGWFLRVNHITRYGTEPETERQTIHPDKPLVFLNMDAIPGTTCLIWEPIMDSPGVPCPNPRVIMPRQSIANHVDGVVEIDVRSFGIRTPPTTREKPSYGIVGLFHVLPPALAWIWRLVAPRGFANPSVIDTGGMKSEGVGSYWPFATGKKIDQANLLLNQILKTPGTRYVLIPNQYIGAWKVGFAGQWVTREYLSRRGGAKFRPAVLVESRCPLLGYALNSIKIDGTEIRKSFLQVNLQPEVGNEGYDVGAGILTNFFKGELEAYMAWELDDLGRKIIEACLEGATVKDYSDLIPMVR